MTMHWNTKNIIWGDLDRYEEWEIHNGGPDPFAIRQSGNLYEYTLSNPLRFLDLDGKCIRIIASGIGGLVGGATNLVTQGLENGFNNIDWGEVGVSAVGSAAQTYVMFTPWLTSGAATGINMAIAGGSYLLTNDRDEWNLVEFLIETGSAGIFTNLGLRGGNPSQLGQFFTTTLGSNGLELIEILPPNFWSALLSTVGREAWDGFRDATITWSIIQYFRDRWGLPSGIEAFREWLDSIFSDDYQDEYGGIYGSSN